MTDFHVLSVQDIFIIFSCVFLVILISELYQYLTAKASWGHKQKAGQAITAELMSGGSRRIFPTTRVARTSPIGVNSNIDFILHLEAAIELAVRSITNGSLEECPDFLVSLDRSLLQYLTGRPSKPNLEFAYLHYIQPMMNLIVEHEYYKLPAGLEMARHLHKATLAYDTLLRPSRRNKAAIPSCMTA